TDRPPVDETPTKGGDAEDDTLLDIHNLTGSPWDDVLTGDKNANVLKGGEGSDLLQGGGGQDSFIGGTGAPTDVDIVTFLDAERGVSADRSTGIGTAGDGSQITLSEIEGLTGSRFKDTLVGNSGDNVLTGGKGPDHLTGNGGADTFVYTSTADS